ncbi:GDP-mannose-dependent alpha-mannosyltransferase [Peptococcaceae bacterium CEB3]|nr:GDP-mannose-dependent alpha-mannosyltransferase [Peptococcaceae bacterium CEB3]
MKMAIVTETFFPSRDGVVTRLCATVRGLRSNGHDLLIVVPDLGIDEFGGTVVRGVPARTFFFYPDSEVCSIHIKNKKCLQEFRPDVVHVVNPALLGAAGIYYSRQLGLPLIAHL